MIAQVFVISTALALGMVLVCIIGEGKAKDILTMLLGVLLCIGAVLLTLVVWLMPFVILVGVTKLIWNAL